MRPPHERGQHLRMVHKSGRRRVGYSNEAPPPAVTRETATRRVKKGPPEEETGWVALKVMGAPPVKIPWRLMYFSAFGFR